MIYFLVGPKSLILTRRIPLHLKYFILQSFISASELGDLIVSDQRFLVFFTLKIIFIIVLPGCVLLFFIARFIFISDSSGGAMVGRLLTALKSSICEFGLLELILVF